MKLLFFVTSVLLFGGFIFFSFLVAKGQFVHVDFNTTVKIQDHISRRFDAPFTIFSLLGSVEITGLVWGCLLILALTKKFWLTLVTLFLFPASLLTELYGKLFVRHPSPPQLFYRGVNTFNFPSDYVHTDYSYPSGHATRTSFLIAFLLLWFYFKSPSWLKWPIKLGLLGFLGVMLVSRVYLGEHWLSDVVGGTLLGTSLGLLAGLTIPTRKATV